MRRVDSANPWLPILLAAVLIAFLGLAPRPQAEVQALRQAGYLLDSGQPGQAAELIAQVAGRTPERIDLWEQAGQAALHGGDSAAAISYLERGAAQAQTSPAYPGGLSLAGWLDLGDAYTQAGDPAAALRAWQVGLAFYGLHPPILERTTAARLALGNFSGAAADLQALADLQPQDPHPYFRLGLLLAAIQPEQAQGPLDRAAALNPVYQPAAANLRRALISARRADDPAYTRLAAGRFLAGLDEWGLAYHAFTIVVDMRPDYAEAWAYRGEARQHPGVGTLLTLPAPVDAPAARRDLETALALDPHSLAGHTFLALFWSRQGRSDLAPALLDQAIANDPHNPALWVQKASAQAAAGDLLAADSTYRLAADMAQGDPAYRRYWIEFMLQYNFQVAGQALPAARQLAVDYPTDPAILDVMAQTLLRLGDLHSAGRFVEQTLQLDPAYAPAYLRRGQVYSLLGDWTAARQALLQAQTLDPAGPVGAQARRWIEDYLR